MTFRHSHHLRSHAWLAQQRGVVLFIALIVMVAMSLAAIALIRSVDTTSQVIANLAFRQASILPANQAIEDAASGLFADAGGPRILDVRVDTPNQNYYQAHDVAWDNVLGVPDPLTTKAKAGALKRQFPDASTGINVTYVTERMCNANVASPPRPAGAETDLTWCDVIAPKGSGCHTINEPCAFDFPAQAYYRVTVRVDGPQNTVSFVQAVLR